MPSSVNLMGLAVELQVSFEWLATGRGPMRISEEDGVGAARLECIARSQEEEDLLIAYRSLSFRNREAVLTVISQMCGTRKAPARLRRSPAQLQDQ
jgi:hypothetical protein